MDLLNELKQNAEALQQDNAAVREKDAKNLLLIQAQMTQIFEYFRSLAEQLQILKPPSPHTYLIFGIGEFSHVAMKDCMTRARSFQVEDKNYYEYIEFSINWLARSPLQASYTSNNEVKYLKDRLWNLGCKVEEKLIKNSDGKLVKTIVSILPEFPTRLRFENDYKSGTIRLNIRNLNKFEDDWQVLTPEQCSTELFEDLAKELLGKPNELATRFTQR
ncbi:MULTISPECIES: hypothetical protein [Deefgea]|uniref:Uncharacterized protein n=1 Tax=Deefgea chitinilytica TaxID=570276 RepID=A0ABS2CAY5_9NEIS|nr:MULTISPECIES: hypothetical protein [Deefgea]MBM5570805.1 hypothetical protein [Deefgea chitinilytica]MBM9888034.1 hypothetical protein [Deefgea sp. CFH1-16]